MLWRCHGVYAWLNECGAGLWFRFTRTKLSVDRKRRYYHRRHGHHRKLSRDVASSSNENFSGFRAAYQCITLLFPSNKHFAFLKWHRRQESHQRRNNRNNNADMRQSLQGRGDISAYNLIIAAVSSTVRNEKAISTYFYDLNKRVYTRHQCLQ